MCDRKGDMSTMTINSEDKEPIKSNTEPKKISLAEAMKQKLANKKQQQQEGRNIDGFTKINAMKSQQNKKQQNNQRRKMGGS